MQWNELTELSQLDALNQESIHQKVMIYKHSTRCSTSSAVLNRLERAWQEEDSKLIKPYFLDLIRHRSLSNAVTERFNVEHESPQVLILDKGQCIYHNSHFGINYTEIKERVKTQTQPTG
ncbi:MAG: bacillithiol system redox-active protein YtxJ [Cyclobacteriaceae bacterium]|nr:bacillithiol system redox-active protein YtxJ [Cyclobacteriaceae bacterium]